MISRFCLIILRRIFYRKTYTTYPVDIRWLQETKKFVWTIKWYRIVFICFQLFHWFSDMRVLAELRYLRPPKSCQDQTQELSCRALSGSCWNVSQAVCDNIFKQQFQQESRKFQTKGMPMQTPSRNPFHRPIQFLLRSLTLPEFLGVLVEALDLFCIHMSVNFRGVTRALPAREAWAKTQHNPHFANAPENAKENPLQPSGDLGSVDQGHSQDLQIFRPVHKLLHSPMSRPAVRNQPITPSRPIGIELPRK